MYLRDFYRAWIGSSPAGKAGLGIVLASQWMCRAEHCEQSSKHGGSVPDAKLGSRPKEWAYGRGSRLLQRLQNATLHRPPRNYQLKDRSPSAVGTIFMSARSRAMIWPARLLSFEILLSARRASSRSSGGVRSQFNPACALVTAAAIASTISWVCAL